jgi:hypothetical protein
MTLNIARDIGISTDNRYGLRKQWELSILVNQPIGSEKTDMFFSAIVTMAQHPMNISTLGTNKYVNHFLTLGF